MKISQIQPITSLSIESHSCTLVNKSKSILENVLFENSTSILSAKYLEDTSHMIQIFLQQKHSWKRREATPGKQNLTLPSSGSNYNIQTRSAETPHDPEIDRIHEDTGWDMILAALRTKEEGNFESYISIIVVSLTLAGVLLQFKYIISIKLCTK